MCCFIEEDLNLGFSSFFHGFSCFVEDENRRDGDEFRNKFLSMLNNEGAC